MASVKSILISALRLEEGLSEWRPRFANRMFGLTEAAALSYGDIMGAAARQRTGHVRAGRDDCRDCARERRNARHSKSCRFREDGLKLIFPWDF